MKDFPAIYPIVNLDSLSREGVDILVYSQQLLKAGVGILQIRAKETNDRDFLEASKAIVALVNESQSDTKVIINDRVDICQLAAADGVHVGQDDLPPEIARKQLGEDAVVGLSTHNREQFLAAINNPDSAAALSYIALGPIYETSSKEAASPVVGCQLLQELAANCQLPIVAIGGINSQRASEVFKAGADCLSIISDLANTKDKTAYIRNISTLKHTTN